MRREQRIVFVALDHGRRSRACMTLDAALRVEARAAVRRWALAYDPPSEREPWDRPQTLEESTRDEIRMARAYRRALRLRVHLWNLDNPARAPRRLEVGASRVNDLRVEAPGPWWFVPALSAETLAARARDEEHAF